MSTRMNPGRQLILGIFIVSALGLLGYYTLFLKEFSLFSEQAQINVTFDEARGLRAGDAVLVAGVRWGRVAEVEYDSAAELDRRITVVATLTNPVEFREGGSFQIKDSTLLGGRVLRPPVLQEGHFVPHKPAALERVVAEVGDDAVEELFDRRVELWCFAERRRDLPANTDIQLSLVYRLAHELRTPLTALSGFIETMRGPAKDDKDSWDRFLAIMAGETERMSRLIADLLLLRADGPFLLGQDLLREPLVLDPQRFLHLHAARELRRHVLHGRGLRGAHVEHYWCQIGEDGDAQGCTLWWFQGVRICCRATWTPYVQAHAFLR